MCWRRSTSPAPTRWSGRCCWPARGPGSCTSAPLRNTGGPSRAVRWMSPRSPGPSRRTGPRSWPALAWSSGGGRPGSAAGCRGCSTRSAPARPGPGRGGGPRIAQRRGPPCGGRAVTKLASDRLSLGRPQLVVPAYFRPDVRPDDWNLLAKHASQVRLVILNLANGPGPLPDPAFYPALDRLREAGVPVAGYVDSNYGRRPGREALDDLGLFLRWYHVAGVCFDRAAVTAEHLGYYAALSRYARDMGARVVLFNHGAHPLEAYAEHADLLGTFEGPWRPYVHLPLPRSPRSPPPGKS